MTAPPPDAEIERLVDAYGEAVARTALARADDDGLSAHRERVHDRAIAAELTARSALLAAISRRVPGDLAELLVEHAEADAAYRNAEAAGLSAQLLVPFARKADDLSFEIAEWTRANLPAKETTDA